MITVQPDSRLDMERRAAEAQAARRPAVQSVRPPARNIATILTLGDTVYFNFRGRPFGVPPLPWKAGERLLAIYLRALDSAHAMVEGASVGGEHGKAQRAEYYAALGELAPLLWSLCRPVGRIRRLLHWLRIFRNPFLAATERELLELADFFSQRRTRSGVTFPTVKGQPDHAISSMT